MYVLNRHHPLHDALIEDLLDRAQTTLGQPPAHPQQYSPYVRALRALIRRAMRPSTQKN